MKWNYQNGFQAQFIERVSLKTIAFRDSQLIKQERIEARTGNAQF